MTLPATGAISMGQVNTELGLSSTATITLNDANVRTLAGVASGAISLDNLHGKTWSTAWTGTISTNQTNLNLRSWAISAGWNGTSKATITINAGVYVYSTATGTPALTIDGAWAGGCFLVNNGFIMGMGGDGGYLVTGSTVAGKAGGKAINLGVSCTITNNSYIGGGGGGGSTGGTVTSGAYGGGGGGAGGGIGRSSASTGGAGGAAGAAGSAPPTTQGGGGGGRIMPGTGGAGRVSPAFAAGGGAGGGGGGQSALISSSPVTGAIYGNGAGGGGGGWGAAGGSGIFATSNSGASQKTGGAGGAAGAVGSNAGPSGTANANFGAGGACVSLNGFTVTWVATGTRYGTIA